MRYPELDAARDPATSAEALQSLANDRNHFVREAVADHLSTPLPWLAALSLDKHEDVRWRVGRNPNTPGEILDSLATDENYLVRSSVSKNPDAPSGALDFIGTDSYDFIREQVADNPSTSSGMLVSLASDKSSRVRYAVSRNTNTPAEALDILAEDGMNAFIRHAVALHPASSDTALNTLVRVAERVSTFETALKNISQAIFSHPNASDATKERLRNLLLKKGYSEAAIAQVSPPVKRVPQR